MRRNNAFLTAACVVGSWKMLGLIAGHVTVNVWFGAQTFVVGPIKMGVIIFCRTLGVVFIMCYVTKVV